MRVWIGSWCGYDLGCIQYESGLVVDVASYVGMIKAAYNASLDW